MCATSWSKARVASLRFLRPETGRDTSPPKLELDAPDDDGTLALPLVADDIDRRLLQGRGLLKC